LTKITMVRVSIDVLVSGSVDDSLNTAKEFLIDAIPHMFGPDEGEGRVIIEELFYSGTGGITIVIFMYIIPLCIIFTPEIRKSVYRVRKKSN